ncbi:peroxisome assembly factor 2 isoform X1 [Athalia rosae]|uniref:peroxisome assembly factor 2 isoform X1 n=1 Tax=Athalia rosae TaxID=37344 RepID=UPI002033A2E0|nr:peroxisome assembly factor 2 isoform X1 [Athalia rosae]
MNNTAEMRLVKPNIKLLTFITRILAFRDSRFILPLIFANWTYLHLFRLLNMRLRLKSIPDEALQIQRLSKLKSKDSYIDFYSCILASKELLQTSKAQWFYLCCPPSLKKYKVTLLTSSNVKKDELHVSETMRFNIENFLNVRDSETARFFIIAASDFDQSMAEEAYISMISNPYECPDDLIEALLQNYFSEARFLRPNDVLSIDITRFAPCYQYLVSQNNIKEVIFKIRSLKVDKLTQNSKKGCFIAQGVTTLVQSPTIHSYLPQKHWIPSADYFLTNCPPSLEDPLRSLTACISLYTQTDILVDIKPVFLIKGAEGSGKSSLVQIAAHRMGFNLMSIDFSEIQSLTSAQTEAKLRIVLQNAKNCTPCILLLSNIQIFGKDAEGKEDERIISAFVSELESLYKIESDYPLVVVATLNDSSIVNSLQLLFTETIPIELSSQKERLDCLNWLLATKRFKTNADLSHIASICTDFVLADLNAIVLQAVKIGCKSRSSKLMITQEDFCEAHEYMQSRYSDWIGAPRVPKVYWKDIGGLGDLKSEILRRIELPLLTSAGVGPSRSGLLLYGPPGTGKTLLAKAIATECQIHFLSVKGPELLNMYVGQSEKNVRQVFERARASAPCVIFFDELDSLAPSRGRNGDNGGVMDRVVSQLLAEIDGIESSGSVFIIGATNRPDLIDPALLRPGRFDKLLYVGISTDQMSRLSVLKALTRKFNFFEDGKELEQVVKILPDNVTGADMYAVCSNAWLLAVRRNLENLIEVGTVNHRFGAGKMNAISDRVVVTQEDLIKAAETLVPSVSKEELKRYEKLRSELSPMTR